MKRPSHIGFVLPVFAVAMFGGCELKDRQGHVIIDQKAPRVRVNVNVNAHLRKCRCCKLGMKRCICQGECRCACRVRAEAPPQGTVVSREHPAMNLPVKARQRNWLGPGGGSCVIASTTNLFRWQGRDDLADLFRRSYAGGQTHDSLAAKLDRHHVRYASTLNGDVEFLRWAIRTRRGTGLTYGYGHYQNLIDLDDEYATLLDNNAPDRPYKVPFDRFVSHWRAVGGWATALLLPPAAPLP